MPSSNITFDILANDRASSKFDHLSKSVDHSGGALSKFGNLAKSAAKAGALALGAGAVVAAKGLYEMAQGAAEDQASASRLATTLKTVADATDGQIASTERWISAQGKAFGVTDDDLRPSLARLVEATHDVGKAQDLAALAMDVSAAKGKPLVAVSEALMKAYNGNIGALGRLGIKTKDAAGETITFDEATKQMADTFGGAASAHADTLAGKMERLKVQLSEAGESIGYKLLPYVSDAADWLGDHLPGALDTLESKAGPVFEAIVDGVGDAVQAVRPAAEEIAEAFGHLVGSGSDVGDVWKGTLLPALETTSDAIAKVVNFIDELPGPVKTFGAEAAIAAIALSKLSSAMVAVKGSAFVAEMTNATTRTAALQTAAKNAAGVAGMVLLTNGLMDAHREGAKFGNVLQGVAGGAGIGAMFGPMGALIGAGAGGGLTALMGAFSDTKESAADLRREQGRLAAMEQHRATIDTIRGSLDELTGAYTRTTRAAALQQVQEAGLIKDGRQFGLSARTIVDASLGQADAIREVERATGRARTTTRTYVDAMGNWHTETVDANVAGTAFRHMLGLTTGDLREASRAQRDAADATATLAERLGLTRKELGQIPRQVRIAIQDDVPDSLREIKRLADETGHLDRKTIKILLEAANIPVTQARIKAVEEQLGGLPKSVQSRISAPGVDLTAEQILRLRKRYDLVPRTVRSLFKQEGIPAGLNGIARIVAANKRIDNKTVRSLIKVLGVDATVAQVRGAAKELDKTGRKTSTPKIRVDGAAGARDTIDGVGGLMRELGRKHADPKLNVDGVPGFLSDFLHANRTIDETGKKTSTPKIAAEGMAAFFSDFARANAVMSVTDSRPPVHTYIYTHHIDTYSRGGGGGGGGGQDGDPSTPGRLMLTSQTAPSLVPTVPDKRPRMLTADRRVVGRQVAPQITVYLGDREIRDVMVKIADDRIEQAEAFAESQRD